MRTATGTTLSFSLQIFQQSELLLPVWFEATTTCGNANQRKKTRKDLIHKLSHKLHFAKPKLQIGLNLNQTQKQCGRMQLLSNYLLVQFIFKNTCLNCLINSSLLKSPFSLINYQYSFFKVQFRGVLVPKFSRKPDFFNMSQNQNVYLKLS